MPAEPVVTAAAPAASQPAARRDGVLGNRDFVRLWAWETVSLIGTQVTQFTLPLVAVITLNATAAEVGVLNALRFVPVIVIALFAGSGWIAGAAGRCSSRAPWPTRS